MNFLITGVSRGIGLGYVTQLLQDKNNQVIGTIRGEIPKELKALLAEFKDRLTIEKCDVTDHKQIQNLKNRIGDKTIDVLINNAGVFLDEVHELTKLDQQTLEKTMAVNLYGPMEVTKEFLPNLLKSKNPKIILMTSLMGSIDDNKSGGYYAYRISKSALNSFGKNLSREYPKITVLMLHPGWVKTDMGGTQAPTEIEDSVSGLLSVIQKSGTKESGGFFNFKNEKLAW